MAQDQTMQQPKGLFGLGGNLGGLMDFSDPQRLIGWQLIANGQKAPGAMFEGIPELAAYGAKVNQQKLEKQQLQQARNSTTEFLKTADPGLSQLVESGALTPKEAYQQWAQKQRDQQEEQAWRSRVDYERQLERQDPRYLLGLQLEQAKLNALNAKPDMDTPEMKTLKARAAAAGLQEGSPEYADFFRNDGKAAQSLSSTDKKEIWKSEDEIPALESTLSTLQRAKDLNGSTYTGRGASWMGSIGATVPGAGYVFDENKAKNTVEFGNLMSEEAIKNMAATLKGATTDEEMNRFMSLLADATTPPEIRERTIERMLTLAQRQKEIKQQRIQELRGQSRPPQRAPVGSVETMSDDELMRIANGG